MAASPKRLKRNALRIGVFKNHLFIEERIFEKKQAVVLGVHPSSDVYLDLPLLRERKVTGIKVFDIDEDGHWVLRLLPEMHGRLRMKDNLLEFHELRSLPNIEREGDVHLIPLKQNTEGKILIGDVSILFHFVAVIPYAKALPSKMKSNVKYLVGNLGLLLMISFFVALILQVLPLEFVVQVDWPEHEDYQIIPDWSEEVKVSYADEPKEEEPKEEEQEEEEVEASTQKVKEKKRTRPTKVAQRGRGRISLKSRRRVKGAAARRARRAAGRAAVQAMLFGVDSGGSGGRDVQLVTESTAMTASLENLTQADIAGSDSATAALELSSAPGGSEVGLKEIGGGVEKGPGKNASAPKKPKKKKIKLKGSKSKFMGNIAKGDQTSIEKVFVKYKKHVAACYSHLVMKRGNLSGKVIIQINIDAKGKVTKVRIIKNGVHPDLGKCLQSKIKKWRFPATGKPAKFAKSWIFG